MKREMVIRVNAGEDEGLRSRLYIRGWERAGYRSLEEAGKDRLDGIMVYLASEYMLDFKRWSFRSKCGCSCGCCPGWVMIGEKGWYIFVDLHPMTKKEIKAKRKPRV